MSKTEEIKKEVSSRFPRLGVNKKREISRLIFEIASRENLAYREVFNELQEKKLSSFEGMKKHLLKRRFPLSYGKKLNPYLPALDIREELRAPLGEEALYPENIYYDRAGEKSPVLGKITEKYPRAKRVKIESLKSFIKEKGFSIESFNRRRKNFFVTGEKYDFLKSCPCTSGAVNCGYNIINMGFGCPYECTYCYLQEYTNTAGIVIPANPEDFIREMKENIRPGRRYGTGEFTDSLALDKITGFSKLLIEFFSSSDSVLELKTKSSNINNILDLTPSENCVVSWSLNPRGFIEKNEFYTASLKERLKSARKCAEAGWDVSFHFDPIVLYPGWEEEYSQVVKMMFEYVLPEKIRWISLGTFRFKRELKKIIENRFPQSSILNGELTIDFDGKLRYPRRMRENAYRKMKKEIRKEGKDIFIYLCMEDKEMWKRAGLKSQWRWK